MPVTRNMNTKSGCMKLSEQEDVFVHHVLKGMKHGPAAVRAGFTERDVPKLLHREVVMKALLRPFGLMSIEWQKLWKDTKRCLSDIINLTGSGAKATPAIQVQACKVVAITLSNIDPKLMLDEVAEMSKDEATTAILGDQSASGKAN